MCALPALVMAWLSGLAQVGVELPPGVKDAQHDDLFGIDDEGDADPPLEPDDPEAGADVVTQGAALGEEIEAGQMVQDALHISSGSPR